MRCYTPISLVINAIQNGFHLAHGPLFFTISAIGFSFLLRYPHYIQSFLAINYFYNTIYIISLHYVYDRLSLGYNCYDRLSLRYTFIPFLSIKLYYTFLQTKYDAVWIIYT